MHPVLHPFVGAWQQGRGPRLPWTGLWEKVEVAGCGAQGQAQAQGLQSCQPWQRLLASLALGPRPTVETSSALQLAGPAIHRPWCIITDAIVHTNELSHAKPFKVVNNARSR